MSFCDWPGITCGANRHPGRVTALSMGSYNLTGTLSPSLANLTFLRHLNLSGNKLHGRIPSDFGRLLNLRDLDLRHNSLEGDIPVSITHCTKLRILFLNWNNLIGQIPTNFSQCKDLNTMNLNKNQLVGTIPASLGSLSTLYLLALGANQLTGGIPPSFGNLSSLAYLDLAENNLGGHIPDELGRVSTLKYLTFAVNSFSGEIPASLFNISSIYLFNVGNNNLTGVLPNDMGSTLPNLQLFSVFYNQLTGTFPTSLSNASGLQKIVLHGNMFVGPIPKDLGSLPNLTAFDIGRNQLEAGDWQFLTALANCTNLGILYLSHNNLQGLLPSSVANLSMQLNWLSMSGNQISGIIPVGIGRFNKLTVFEMDSNLLRGNIPSTIGMLENLHELDLSHNQLHGQITVSIGNLSQLNELGLADNELQGSIPPSIGNLLSLDALNLSYNELASTIPGGALSQLSSLSQYFDLSHNMLTGELPSQISSLINLNILDVSDNRLSGNIPGALGACLVLERVFLQGNFFQGLIPSAISGLKGIQELDLSHNNLSGPIPEFLGSFHLLYHLNLSFNDLDGQVPQGGVFSNTSAVSLLGNSKLCGGNQEFHLQPCDHSDGRSANRSSAGVTVPVVIVSILILVILAPAVCYYIWKRKKNESRSVPFPKKPFLQISYDEINKATDGFSSSNLIGAGSFSTVYKGVMDSDPNRMVAIKVLNLEQIGADRSFIAECDSLRVIRHRNLANIVTVCSSVDHNGDDFKALIFEYMPNGSLDEWLHPRKKSTNSRSLSLLERWNVVIDVALALDYLHNHCQTQIVHCDLKPSNVLLGHDMSAHVCDFGLSRFIIHRTTGSSQDANSSVGIKGTIGYIAPEYGMGGNVTAQGDVYSYGVLLLETFTGKRPTDDMFQSELNLQKYVEMAYPDRVLDVIDSAILLNDEETGDSCAGEPTEHRSWMHECMGTILGIGLLCSKESSNERMKIGDAIKELLLVKEGIWSGWTQHCRLKEQSFAEIDSDQL